MFGKIFKAGRILTKIGKKILNNGGDNNEYDTENDEDTSVEQWQIVSAIIGVVILIFMIVGIVSLYNYNLNNYPVLLTKPIRGGDFIPYSTNKHKKINPSIDRNYSTDGIKLPYRDNDLIFIKERHPLPELNHQVQFTISFWMKVENLPIVNQNHTTLLSQNGNQFNIQYDNSQNTLIVNIRVKNNVSVTNQQNILSFSIPNIIKIQSWQMITVVVDNRYLDIYSNNQLQRSIFLSNVPYLTNNSWRLFPGESPFMGTLTCIRYFNYSFNEHEIIRLFKWYNPFFPNESYFFWWTWFQGNAFTALFNSNT